MIDIVSILGGLFDDPQPQVKFNAAVASPFEFLAFAVSV
jgi:hypothetical protein